MSRPFALQLPAAIASTVAAVVLASTASAADLRGSFVPSPAALPPVFTWTGIFVGLQGGYDGAHDHLDELVTATRVSTGSVYDYSPDGFVGGGHIGVNYQVQSFVLGLVGDVEGSTATAGFLDPSGYGRGRDDLPWRASVRGRIGYAFGNVLAYATGGVAFAGLDTFYVRLPAFPPLPSFAREGFSRTLTGWTVGGGLSVALSEHWIASGEYRHSDYGRIYNASAVAFPGLTGRQDIRSDSGEVAISYKF